jgi:glycine cleavage system H protein
MADALIFLMGKYEARLPGELRYARNHMWCRPEEKRFGFSAYAVRLMQDVYFLEWTQGDGAAVQEYQQIGHIETSKAVSDLFAPMTGTIAAFNPELLNDPTFINTDTYGAGWLFELQGNDPLMTAEEYQAFLAEHWVKAQRLLKGQVNLDA